MERLTVTVEINGKEHSAEVEPRMLLSDFIRHEARLTSSTTSPCAPA
jgi:aerobic-type carbon monoxide dehydrogenase small subunit (CoxS/CutS family)